jgi:hypothetical protein
MDDEPHALALAGEQCQYLCLEPDTAVVKAKFSLSGFDLLDQKKTTPSPCCCFFRPCLMSSSHSKSRKSCPPTCEKECCAGSSLGWGELAQTLLTVVGAWACAGTLCDSKCAPPNPNLATRVRGRSVPRRRSASLALQWTVNNPANHANQSANHASHANRSPLAVRPPVKRSVTKRTVRLFSGALALVMN